MRRGLICPFNIWVMSTIKRIRYIIIAGMMALAAVVMALKTCFSYNVITISRSLFIQTLHR